ncbi:MAG: LysM peptidoglycan-binding domain-containing protein [Planctomycetes bacterium]|nr:LysM peptidoglycan-binding domain-containing protein [Planctomycetota bacterium]
MADGLLAKLTITPFEDSDTAQVGPPAGPPFIAQFNPESFTVNNEIDYGTDASGQGDDGGPAKFKGVKPRSFTFDFLLDGTGAAGDTNDVLAMLVLFKATVGFSGDVHRPRFLLLQWGAFLATCVLQSYSITYKLFRPDGTPLRAVLSTSFREHKSKAFEELTKNLSSPDRMHAHLVKEGEHLSLVTYRIYKDPRYYFHVGEKNGLDNLREIAPGSMLYLPPLG